MSLRLTIITINFNNAAGLRKTMESVLTQISKDFEYIIIDGGSNDGSVEIIKSFTDIPPGIYMPHAPCSLPINYWVSEPDRGIYHAMNKGILVAKGEYCQFLNSGDWLANSNVTEQMLTCIPDCNIFYGNMVKQLPNGKIFRNKKIPVESFLTFFSSTLNHSPAYIKRCLFSKYGMYDENLKIVSDWKFFLISIALNSEKVCYHDLDVSFFNMKGISNVEKELDVIERRKVLREIIPSTILSDYEEYGGYILKMKRLDRFGITRWLVWFMERILFKLEKIETHIKNEHIFY